MTYLETQQNDVQAAKEEARRLRTKMKTFERYLQSYNHCHVKAFKYGHNMTHSVDWGC